MAGIRNRTLDSQLQVYRTMRCRPSGFPPFTRVIGERDLIVLYSGEVFCRWSQDMSPCPVDTRFANERSLILHIRRVHHATVEVITRPSLGWKYCFSKMIPANVLSPRAGGEWGRSSATLNISAPNPASRHATITQSKGRSEAAEGRCKNIDIKSLIPGDSDLDGDGSGGPADASDGDTRNDVNGSDTPAGGDHTIRGDDTGLRESQSIRPKRKIVPVDQPDQRNHPSPGVDRILQLLRTCPGYDMLVTEHLSKAVFSEISSLSDPTTQCWAAARSNLPRLIPCSNCFPQGPPPHRALYAAIERQKMTSTNSGVFCQDRVMIALNVHDEADQEEWTRLHSGLLKQMSDGSDFGQEALMWFGFNLSDAGTGKSMSVPRKALGETLTAKLRTLVLATAKGFITDFHIDGGIPGLSVAIAPCVKVFMIFPGSDHNYRCLREARDVGQPYIEKCLNKLEGGILAYVDSQAGVYLPPGCIHAVFTVESGFLVGVDWISSDNHVAFARYLLHGLDDDQDLKDILDLSVKIFRHAMRSRDVADLISTFLSWTRIRQLFGSKQESWNVQTTSSTARTDGGDAGDDSSVEGDWRAPSDIRSETDGMVSSANCGRDYVAELYQLVKQHMDSHSRMALVEEFARQTSPPESSLDKPHVSMNAQ